MKYIIGQSLLTGHYYVTVFDEGTIHKYVAQAMKKSIGDRFEIRSAGFVHLVKGNWVVTPERESYSLKLGPHPEDQTILTLFLSQGLTGLDLVNMLQFLAFSTLKKVRG